MGREVLYHGNVYSSVREIPGIPRINNNSALDGLMCQPRPTYPEIVRTHHGNLNFVSYRGINLLPSPDTYLLAQRVGKVISDGVIGNSPTILDVGTGSGLIAITIADVLRDRKELRHKIIATDISGPALEVAALNSQLNDVEDIQFRKRDMLEGIRKEFGVVDIVICNPPFYYGNKIPHKVRKNKFIPELAVNGGTDSLKFYRKLFETVPTVLSDTGVVVVQLQDYKIDEIQAIAKKCISNISMIALKGLRGYVTTLVIGNRNLVEHFGKRFVDQKQLVGV